MRTPPRGMERLLAMLLSDDVAGRSILGDLRQEFVRRADASARAAGWWYRREAAAVAVRAAWDRAAGRAPSSPRAYERKGDPVWRNLMDDARHALRGLAKTPRFTAIAALTLSLGIGASAAIFSVVDGVLLDPLDYPEPGSLVNVGSTAPGLGYDRFGTSPDLYFYYRERSRAFSEIGVYQLARATLTGDGEPVQVPVAAVTHTLLPVLGVDVALGRGFRPDDDVPDAPRVVLLSHGLWQRRYGGDPAIVNRNISMNGEPAVVVGVLPEDFAFLREAFSQDRAQGGAGGADVWYPARLDPVNPLNGSFGWNGVARLNRGVTAEAAQAQLAALIPTFLDDNQVGDTYRAFMENGRYSPVVASMRDEMVGSIDGALWILMGTVLVVLLIACANVANLFLIRAEGRQRDTAVQAALGASRGVLIRKTVMEALTLAGIGGGAGLLLAAAGVPLLVRIAPPQIPRLENVALDWRVALFALAAAALSAALFGVVPAIRYTRPAILATLRHGGRGATVGRARNRVRGLLVVAQTALALVLLVGSGLLVRSLQRALSTDPGFETADRLTFRISLPQAKYPDGEAATRLHALLVDRIAAVPGVESVAAASALPLVGSVPGTAYLAEGRPPEPGTLPPMLHSKLVSPGYLSTMGVKLRAGRDFTLADESSENIIVNSVVADRLWPGEDPVGRRLRSVGDTVGWYTVVGVVEPVLHAGYRQPPMPLIYSPVGAPRHMVTPFAMSYVVRGNGIAERTAAIRSAVWEIDPELPLAGVETMDEIAADSVVTLSFTVMTLGIAAVLALILGAIGLYGVLGYAVSMRTREIGVRMALGAQRGTVMRMVIGQGARLAIVGLVVGIAGAAAGTRVLTGVLFGVEALDATTFALMSGIFLAVALLASWLPARRAAAVDPLQSLQNE